MRVLVTGGCGFIGHRVVYLLEKQGHDVLVVDNHTTYGSIHSDELTTLVRERKKFINSKVLTVDICDFASLHKSTEFDPDVIIHLASFPRQKSVDINPQEGVKTMMEGLLNVLELSKHKRLIYISSSMVYGDMDGPAKESDPCTPKGLYAIMKYTGEKMVKDYGRRYGMGYNIIRPSAVYGPRDVGDRVVAKFLYNAMTDKPLYVNGKEEKLDFSFVDDTASGICRVANLGLPNETYNITRGQARTIYDAAMCVRDIIGPNIVDVVVREKDSKFPSRDALCIDKAREQLGYDPQINLEQGLQSYYDWFTHFYPDIHWFNETI